MFRLSFLFVTVTALEIYLLFQVGFHLGAGVTVGMILLTGILGAYFARQQGFAILQKIQRHLQAGQMPAGELLHGVCVLIASAFLVTPGFLTDITGFLLLVPPFRRWLLSRLQARIERWMQTQAVVFTSQARFVSMGDDSFPRSPHPPLDRRGNPPFEV
jgi:UPF0716 protein FxsA